MKYKYRIERIQVPIRTEPDEGALMKAINDVRKKDERIVSVFSESEFADDRYISVLFEKAVKKKKKKKTADNESQTRPDIPGQN